MEKKICFKYENCVGAHSYVKTNVIMWNHMLLDVYLPQRLVRTS